MGLILSTTASLMLVWGGMHGIDRLFERYATPEARMQAKSNMAAEEAPTPIEKRTVIKRRSGESR
jgi:hypothetical protein